MTSLALPAILESLRNSLEKLPAPCILLLPAETNTRLTRLGGLPLLAPGSTWPNGADGPLPFVGQIDFAEVAASRGVELGLPDHGLLALFCAAEFWTGGHPDDRLRFRVIYTPDTKHAVELAAPEELEVAEIESLAPLSALALPDLDDRLVEAYESLQEGARRDAYVDFRDAFKDQQRAGSDGNDHCLRGYASWIGDDGRLDAQLAASGLDASHSDSPEARALAAGASAWNLLWQIETIGLQPFDEVGYFLLLIRDEDLAARAFDRAWVLHQTY